MSDSELSASTDELGDWEDVTSDQMPKTWGDECKRYRIVCSNGFVGQYGLESALLHKPALWPQCYPNDAEDSCCTVKAQRRQLPNTISTNTPK